MINLKLKIEEAKKIKDGVHEGIIKAVEYRTEPFNYTDFVIEVKNEFTMKASFPTQVTPKSMLGRVLEAFGATLEVGCELDPEKIVVGRTCTFQTMHDGKFANIVKGSVKPK